MAVPLWDTHQATERGKERGVTPEGVKKSCSPGVDGTEGCHLEPTSPPVSSGLQKPLALGLTQVAKALKLTRLLSLGAPV